MYEIHVHVHVCAYINRMAAVITVAPKGSVALSKQATRVA
jgi:hypothetical protein